MSDGSILTVGEGLFELGLDDDGGPLREGFGGDAANTAVMAARMGAPARLVGRVGDDTLGHRLLAFWRSCDVGVDDVVVDPSRPTGIYVNRRGVDGAHRFDYHRAGSAGSVIGPTDVEHVRTDGIAFVHFTGIGLAVSESSAQACAALAQRARATGSRISFSANVRPRLAPDLDALRHAAAAADVVFLSVDDATLVYGSVENAVAELSRTVAELVVTDGDRGATLHTGGDAIALHAPEVAFVDAAGAGDAVAGAYLAARARGDEPAVALAQGIVAGALSCRAFGCASSYPTSADVLVGCMAMGGVSI